MATREEIKRVRSFVSEDALRRGLMALEKRDVVDLYLELRFDKQTLNTPKLVNLQKQNEVLIEENVSLKRTVAELQQENEILKGENYEYEI